MIKMFYEKGRNYPKIYCDACDQEIGDAKKANAIWVSEVDNEQSKVYYVHKGKCDKKISGTFQNATASDDLDMHIAKLLANLGLVGINVNDKKSSYNYEKISNAFERIKEMNEIFG